MYSKKLLLFSTLASAVPSVAQQPAPLASPTPATGQAVKQFCRREQTLGSIMPGKKFCHTKAAWDAIDLANNDAANNALSRRNNRTNGGN